MLGRPRKTPGKSWDVTRGRRREQDLGIREVGDRSKVWVSGKWEIGTRSGNLGNERKKQDLGSGKWEIGARSRYLGSGRQAQDLGIWEVGERRKIWVLGHGRQEQNLCFWEGRGMQLGFVGGKEKGNLENRKQRA